MAAWTGELVGARTQIQSAQRRFLQAGTEIDILWAANHPTMIDLWLGRYDEAAATAADAVQRAEQLGGKHLLISSWLVRPRSQRTSVTRMRLASPPGRPSTRPGPLEPLFSLTAITAHAFLEVSLGNYASALAAWNRCWSRSTRSTTPRSWWAPMSLTQSNR